MKRLCLVPVVLAAFAAALPVVATAVALAANSGGPAPLDELRQQVWKTEEAFAKTMADRDFAAFKAFLSPETVFWSGGVKRGPAEVASYWKRFYEGPKPPFSWRPDAVEVLASGTLAFSSGPVLDENGARVGTFNSVWRREADGRWLIVFDKGCPACEAK